MNALSVDRPVPADAASGSAGRGSRLIAWVRRHPIAAIWAAWSIVLLLVDAPAIVHLRGHDPDDMLRLLEVRDWLAGQSWFDVTQYRMDPPHGAAMHWSRLVDLPIAAVLWPARWLLPDPAATRLAMAVVPLAQLLLAMVLLSRLVATLGGGIAERLIAAAIVPLFPLVLDCFEPMRIDHHGWQAIAALGCAWCFVRSPDRRAALAGGATAALWLSVSLEGLPLVTLIAALYGVRFALFGERDLAVFLSGLSAASVVAHVATRPAAELLPHCDSVGWPHLAAFAVAAVLTGAATSVRSRDARTAVAWRIALLALIGAIAGTLIVVPIGSCAINPFAALDPVMERYWHGVIPEGLPITRQLLSMRLVLVWPALMVIAAIRLGLPDRRRPIAERRWLWLALLVLGATPIGWLVMREGVNVALLSIPFSALLIVRLLPRVRRIPGMAQRVVATIALPLVATPAGASALLKPFDDMVAFGVRQSLPVYRSASVPDDAECDLASLAALPPGLMFATLDIGPEILVRTAHTVVASGYHRNMARMRDVVEGFSGDPAAAEAIVRADRARYVVLCLTGGDTAVFRSRRRDALANRLTDGRPPSWLAPVRGFDGGPLRVFRVLPAR